MNPNTTLNSMSSEQIAALYELSIQNSRQALEKAASELSKKTDATVGDLFNLQIQAIQGQNLENLLKSCNFTAVPRPTPKPVDEKK